MTHNTGRRPRRIFPFVVVTAIVTVAALEIGLRALGHQATWSERNGGEYVSPYSRRNKVPWLHVGKPYDVFTFGQPEFDFEVRLSSEGLRDTEHPLEKPEGEFRIVGLGDSFTLGQGAAFENTFLERLEALAADAAQRPVLAIGGGKAGTDPVFSLNLLSRRLLKYRPDLVLLVINDSDITDIITRGGLDRFDESGFMVPPPAPAIEALFRRSFLFRAVIMGPLFRYSWELLSPAEREKRAAEAREVIVDVAREIRDMGAKHRFRLLVVTHPTGDDSLSANAGPTLPLLAAGLREEEIEHLDLTAYFRERVPPGKVAEYFWPIDGHCNARGYDLFARGIMSRIGEYL